MTNLPLWDQLVSGQFQKKVNAAARARKAGKVDSSAAILKNLGLSTPPPRPSPWKAVAVTLPVSVTTCRCGATHRSPAGSPLVRYIHRRNGTLWEVPEHPARFNTSLPRDFTLLHSATEWCEICLPATAPSTATAPAQLDLFTIYVDSTARARAGLVEKHIPSPSAPTLSSALVPPAPHLQIQYIYPSPSTAPAPYSAGALVPLPLPVPVPATAKEPTR